MNKFWQIINGNFKRKDEAFVRFSFIPITAEARAAADVATCRKLCINHDGKAPTGWAIRADCITPGVFRAFNVDSPFLAMPELVAERIAHALPKYVQLLPFAEPYEQLSGKRVLYLHTPMRGLVDVEKTRILSRHPSLGCVVYERPITLLPELVPPAPACFVIEENGYCVADDSARSLMVEAGFRKACFVEHAIR